MTTFMPANINYGNPNASPTNFLESVIQKQQDQELSSQNQNQNQNQTNLQNVKEKYSINKDAVFNFLNLKASTILTFATAVAIGLTFKDLISSLVHNILQPLLMTIIITIDKNNYLPITPILKEKNLQIDVTKFLGSILVVKIVVIFMYFVNKYEDLLF